FERSTRNSSVQRVLHAAERVVQVRSQPLDNHNDGNRDARGDQPVFDRGGAIRIAQEGFQEPHVQPLPRFKVPALRRRCPTSAYAVLLMRLERAVQPKGRIYLGYGGNIRYNAIR